MTFDNHLSLPIVPFLTAYAAQRTGSAEKAGYYSSLKEMWVLDVQGEEVPLINYDSTTASLVTKTMTVQEEDDERAVMNFSELETKTNAQLEQDDQSMSSFLEISTKTDAQLEQDDTVLEMADLFI